jgi:lipoyl(octanoyl) transferase
MVIELIPFKRFSGKYNMEFDGYLFDGLEQGIVKPTLRIYGWEKACISLGYSQNPDLELNVPNCNRYGIEIVKRPTGGGIVFHNEHEVTYSFIYPFDDDILPKGLVPSYKFISNIVIHALNSIGIQAELSNTRHHEQARLCFSFPASYEVTLEGQKIVGSAQKRGKTALLQQGSIFVRNSAFNPSEFIRHSIEFKSIYDILGVEIDQIKLSEAISKAFVSVFNP